MLNTFLNDNQFTELKGDPTDIMHKQLMEMVNFHKQTTGKHNKAQVL
jgi:hypothetical protein